MIPPIGEFNDVLNSDAIAEFEIEHSFGTQVLKILQNMNSSSDYKSYVMNYNVLENIYIDFQTAIYNAHRNIKRQEGN